MPNRRPRRHLPSRRKRAASEAPLRTYGVSLLGAPSLPPDFQYFPYVNPDAPKGGEVVLSAVGTFDSFNPFIVRGTAAGEVSRVWDTLMVPNARRGRERIRPPRESDRTAGRPYGRRLRVAAGGEVQRRHAGHRRGRRLELRDPAREGAALLPAILCRRRLGDRRGAAAGGVPLQVLGQPRTAADPGPASGAAGALVGRARLRQAADRSAAGIRPLPGRPFRVRPHPVDGTRAGCLVEGPAGDAGAEQFRHGAHRIFPRRDGGAGSVQGRADRFPRGEHRQGVGHVLRFSGGGRRGW